MITLDSVATALCQRNRNRSRFLKVSDSNMLEVGHAKQ